MKDWSNQNLFSYEGSWMILSSCMGEKCVKEKLNV